jgi:solute carrier family 35 protein F1/2
VLSLLTVASSSSSQRLSDLGVVAPASQLFCTYALLALVYVPLFFFRRRRRRQQPPPSAAPPSSSPSPPPPYPYRRYILLALLDAEANYLVTSAIPLGGASITSATLLACLSVPAAMLLSWLLLGRRFSARHAAGAAVCALGLGVMVAADASAQGGGASSSSSSSSLLLGDMLAAAGAVLYACSNVMQERSLVVADDNDDEGIGGGIELLASLGVFGSAISGAQALLLERTALRAALQRSSSSPLPFFASFAAALLAFYSLLPLVLTWGGAALLNVSLLTGDVWAAGARVAWFGGFASRDELRAFCAALALVAVGIVLYSTAPGSTSSCDSTGQGAGYRAVATAAGQADDEDEEAGAAAAAAATRAGG